MNFAVEVAHDKYLLHSPLDLRRPRAARVGINELHWEASAPVRLRWMHLVERR